MTDNMLHAFIISTILLIIGVFILGFRIFFIKGGKFPNIHVGSNKALKHKGIQCATSQDREAQKKVKPLSNKEIVIEITKNHN